MKRYTYTENVMLGTLISFLEGIENSLEKLENNRKHNLFVKTANKYTATLVYAQILLFLNTDRHLSEMIKN